jgi:hypothetical protein
MRRNDRNIVPVILKIEKVYSNIDAVKDRPYGMRQHSTYDYYEHLNRMSEKKVQLESKLEELKRSSASTYDQIKEGVEDKIYELSLVVQQIRERFYT